MGKERNCNNRHRLRWQAKMGRHRQTDMDDRQTGYKDGQIHGQRTMDRWTGTGRHGRWQTMADAQIGKSMGWVTRAGAGTGKVRVWVRVAKLPVFTHPCHTRTHERTCSLGAVSTYGKLWHPLSNDDAPSPSPSRQRQRRALSPLPSTSLSPSPSPSTMTHHPHHHPDDDANSKDDNNMRLTRRRGR